jgi:hypothetical protein
LDLGPGRHGAFAQDRVRLGHDQRLSNLFWVPRPSQVGQAPKRVVEGKQPRLDFRNGEAGNRAGEFLRKDSIRSWVSF